MAYKSIKQIAPPNQGVVDVNVIGGNVVLSASDGKTDVEIISISGSEISNTTTILGDSYSTMLSSQDVSFWSNIALTVVNTGAETLESGSVEFSPDNTNWETDWDTNTFSGLTAGSTRSMQISGNSRKYMRMRGISSGSAGALTGSFDVYLHVNNG